MKKIIKILIYWVYLLLVWGIFRLFFKLDNVVEELVIKPLVWGWPIVGWQLWGNKKDRVKLFSGNMMKAVGGGIGLGLLFFGVMLLANWLKAGILFGQNAFAGLNSSEIVTLGLATAIVEESVMAGFVLQNLKSVFKNEGLAVSLTAVINASLHIPIALFIYGYFGFNLLGFLAIVGLVGVGKYYLMLRTDNIWAPIVAHWIWGIAIWALG